MPRGRKTSPEEKLDAVLNVRMTNGEADVIQTEAIRVGPNCNAFVRRILRLGWAAYKAGRQAPAAEGVH